MKDLEKDLLSAETKLYLRQLSDKKHKYISLKNRIEKYKKSQIAFLKWVVVTSVGFLTIFTSTINGIPEDNVQKLCYLIILSFISLGIIFASIAVFGGNHRELLKIYKYLHKIDPEVKLVSNPSSNGNLLLLYDICNILALTLYLFSLIAFAVYNFRTLYLA